MKEDKEARLKRKISELKARISDAESLRRQAVSSRDEVNDIDRSEAPAYEDAAINMAGKKQRLEALLCELQTKLDMIPHEQVLEECEDFLEEATDAGNGDSESDDDE